MSTIEIILLYGMTVSRINLQMDTLDLVQLHCPPTDVITAQCAYDFLDDMVEKGRIARYGVSVENMRASFISYAT